VGADPRGRPERPSDGGSQLDAIREGRWNGNRAFRNGKGKEPEIRAGSGLTEAGTAMDKMDSHNLWINFWAVAQNTEGAIVKLSRGKRVDFCRWPLRPRDAESPATGG
jgi:hypothetical protein